MKLIIVESPNKIATIKKYVGPGYEVAASVGHIADLSTKDSTGLGVDIDNGFKPHYVLNPDKIQVLDKLISLAEKSTEILLATDPDREGAAISWHLAQRLKTTKKPIKRIVFREINKKALDEALKNPGSIDMDLVHAQESRRILDRIVGFKASPFLIQKLGSNLSAGRVQSVVLRLIAEREKEITSFVPKDYWTLNANVVKAGDQQLFSIKYNGDLNSQKEADDLKANLLKATLKVHKVIAKDEKVKPLPPLTTITLQQAMAKQGFTSDATMKIAQTLYEQGYVTYIRTDSERASDDSIKEARKWLSSNKYDMPATPNVYDAKASQADAHECIRPTDVSLTSSKLLGTKDEKEVYDVIWRYFVASQMKPAIFDTLKIDIKDSNGNIYKCSGRAPKYFGFYEILGKPASTSIDIPKLSIGDQLNLFGQQPILVEKKTTKPPSRYNNASILEELKERGIGRPATYASLLTNIVQRKYVVLTQKGKSSILSPTDLGLQIIEELNKHFSFMDYSYTKDMEENLDKVAHGKLSKLDMLKNFYSKFSNELSSAYTNSGCKICVKCAAPMVIRTNKANGQKFYGCSKYPNCKNVENIK